jgi:hypothetical protein
MIAVFEGEKRLYKKKRKRFSLCCGVGWVGIFFFGIYAGYFEGVLGFIGIFGHRCIEVGYLTA